MHDLSMLQKFRIPHCSGQSGPEAYNSMDHDIFAFTLAATSLSSATHTSTIAIQQDAARTSI